MSWASFASEIEQLSHRGRVLGARDAALVVVVDKLRNQSLELTQMEWQHFSFRSWSLRSGGQQWRDAVCTVGLGERLVFLIDLEREPHLEPGHTFLLVVLLMLRNPLRARWVHCRAFGSSHSNVSRIGQPLHVFTRLRETPDNTCINIRKREPRHYWRSKHTIVPTIVPMGTRFCCVANLSSRPFVVLYKKQGGISKKRCY